jgi:phage tail-like protein
VIDGKTERKNGSIVLLDETGAEKIRWNFANGWPTKWTGPSFNATSTAVAIEMLEITHEELQRA